MTDGTTLTVPPVHLPLIHGENVFVDHFLQIHHISRPYIHLSNLAALISNPTALAKVESHPFLGAAILSNPFLAKEISHSPALLNMLARSPELLGAVISNPRLLRIIKGSPEILEEILRNPAQSIEVILQNISERNTSNRPEKNIAEKKPTQPQVLHKSEKPAVVTPKIRSAMKEPIVKIGVEERRIPVNIFNIKTTKGTFQAKISLIQKQSAGIYIDPKTLATHPSLLTLLAAAAFSANRTKIIPIAGNPEDWGIELKTQSERQLSVLEEISPVHEIEEAQESKLVR